MFKVEEIVWTLKSYDDVVDFLNEHFPERLATVDLPGHFTVNKGAVYVSGRKVYFREG